MRAVRACCGGEVRVGGIDCIGDARDPERRVRNDWRMRVRDGCGRCGDAEGAPWGGGSGGMGSGRKVRDTARARIVTCGPFVAPFAAEPAPFVPTAAFACRGDGERRA
eukprot:7376190-Prymnesium_polylepis.1